ncbi:MAG: paraquat-inducible protein A [Verrucomicrobiota bacterium]
MNHLNPLSHSLRWSCFGVLVVALCCNVSVLFVPFLDFRQGLSTETYTIFHTVEMLWAEGIYALAVLVVGFSLIFPFFKLFVLFAVVFSAKPGRIRLRMLNRVELLAKWSMLDVFLVCLVLTLTSGQFLVSATPKLGVPLFIIAVVLSMIVGQILAHRLLERSKHGRQLSILQMNPTPRTRLILVGISGFTLLGALTLPFLKIEAWFLVDDSFSVITVVPSLAEQKSYSAVFATAIFLIVFPVVRWLVLAVRSWYLWKGKERAAENRLFLLARYWSMLDVFALALGVFLLEGRSFVPSDGQIGMALLVGVVLANVLIERLVESDPEEKIGALAATEEV